VESASPIRATEIELVYLDRFDDQDKRSTPGSIRDHHPVGYQDNDYHDSTKSVLLGLAHQFVKFNAFRRFISFSGFTAPESKFTARTSFSFDQTLDFPPIPDYYRN